MLDEVEKGKLMRAAQTQAKGEANGKSISAGNFSHLGSESEVKSRKFAIFFLHAASPVSFWATRKLPEKS